MLPSTTTVRTTMNNISAARYRSVGFFGGALAAFMFTACSAKPAAADDVKLKLAHSSDALTLTVKNDSEEPLSLPADLVNGPRSVTHSVFLEVRNRGGKSLKRCAIIEVEPERMRSVQISKGDEGIFTIPLNTLAATYCASKLSVRAVYGSLTNDDQTVPITSSRQVDVEIKDADP